MNAVRSNQKDLLSSKHQDVTSEPDINERVRGTKPRFNKEVQDYLIEYQRLHPLLFADDEENEFYRFKYANLPSRKCPQLGTDDDWGRWSEQ